MNPAVIITGVKTTAEIISAVTAVVGAADSLKDAVGSVVESDEGRVAVGKAKEAFGGVKKKASGVKVLAGDIVEKASGVKESLAETKKAKKQEKDLAKELKKARQVVLESASQSATYKDFAKLREESSAAAAALAIGLYSGSGCFVAVTYAMLDFDKDLTDYLGVYVGKGVKLDAAVEHAWSREGDPDLYADVKYRQNVHIYAYPCSAEELDRKYEALLSLFQDDRLYNASTQQAG